MSSNDLVVDTQLCKLSQASSGRFRGDSGLCESFRKRKLRRPLLLYTWYSIYHRTKNIEGSYFLLAVGNEASVIYRECNKYQCGYPEATSVRPTLSPEINPGWASSQQSGLLRSVLYSARKFWFGFECFLHENPSGNL